VGREFESLWGHHFSHKNKNSVEITGAWTIFWDRF